MAWCHVPQISRPAPPPRCCCAVAWWAEAVLSSPYFALYQHTSTAIAQFAAEASFDVALKGNKMALPR